VLLIIAEPIEQMKTDRNHGVFYCDSKNHHRLLSIIERLHGLVGGKGKMIRVSVIVGLLLTNMVFAQDSPTTSPSPTRPQISATRPQRSERCGLTKLRLCLKDVVHDQAGIWTSPLRIKAHDALWVAPFGGATSLAFAYDQDALREVGNDRNFINNSDIVSGFGSGYATFGEAGVLYLVGAFTHNDHLRETGVLGAEAVIDASIVAGGLKLATNRQRPDEGPGTGGFWSHGPSDYSLSSSFPSGHAAASWALARVISDEYRGWPIKLGMYGFAAAISASRITSRKHFPSDVVVGGTLGYLIGGYVVHHHSSAVDGDEASIAILPVVDDSRHAYGLTVMFTPSALRAVRAATFFRQLTSGLRH
jgi:membrane-associated phospholipid phosphatase